MSAETGCRRAWVTRVLETALAIGPERERGGLQPAFPCGSVRVHRPSRVSLGDGRLDTGIGAGADGSDCRRCGSAARCVALDPSRRSQGIARQPCAELVGTGAAIADVRKAIVRAAAAPFAVLIEGKQRRQGAGGSRDSSS